MFDPFASSLQTPSGPCYPRSWLYNQEGFEFLGVLADGSTVPGIVRKDFAGFHHAEFPSRPELRFQDFAGWRKIVPSTP